MYSYDGEASLKEDACWQSGSRRSFNSSWFFLSEPRFAASPSLLVHQSWNCTTGTKKNAWHQEWSLLLLKLKTVFKTFKIRTAAGLCIIWWNKTDLYAKRGLNDLCDDFRYCYACVYHIIIHFKQTFMLGMQQCLKIVKKLYK